jgi:glycosyltransferase involved in cell wall biosynthesis
MRIGIEAQRLFRSRKHGMDIVALELIRAIQRLDHSNDYVVFVRPDDDVDCIQESPNVTIVPVEASSYAHWEQIRLPQAAAAAGVDLLHCTANTAPVRCPIPTIVTLHDIIFLEGRSGSAGKGSLYQRLGNTYRRRLVPRIVSRVDRILTVSEYEGRRIKARFPGLQTDVSVVHNAVSNRFSEVRSWDDLAVTRRRYGLPEDFLLFLGNTDPKKNCPAVVEAYCRYASTSPDPLPIVLADFDEARLSRLLKRFRAEDLAESFVLPGYLANEDMPAIYSAATAFLYPSLRESFGLPILEAMACGTPVLTSTTSAMPEVAGTAALLVDPGSVDEMTSGITVLARDARLRQRLRRAGLRRASEFSWDRNAEATLEIYRSVVGDAAARMAA